MLRREIGLTQAELAQTTGVSLKTISNLESSNIEYSFGIEGLFLIAKQLHVHPAMLLIDHASNETDLDEAVKIAERDYYDRNVLKVFYPLMHTRYDFTSLLEFIIFMPLMNPMSLMEAIYAIAGSAVNYEEYIASRISKLIQEIPESLAKNYAIKEAKKIKRIREGENVCIVNITSNLNKEEYEAYLRRLDEMNRYREAINNSIFN